MKIQAVVVLAAFLLLGTLVNESDAFTGPIPPDNGRRKLHGKVWKAFFLQSFDILFGLYYAASLAFVERLLKILALVFTLSPIWLSAIIKDDHFGK